MLDEQNGSGGSVGDVGRVTGVAEGHPDALGGLVERRRIGAWSAAAKLRSASESIGIRWTWQCGTSSPAMIEPTRAGSNAAINA